MDDIRTLLQNLNNQNSKKENLTAHHLSLIQKFENLHSDLLNEENEIAQIYNDFLDYPKGWPICGSNDQINWDPLDHRVILLFRFKSH